MATSILWFRRNLRLDDNDALNAAVEAGLPIIPVYVVDALDEGGASRWWLHHSLEALGESIRQRGGSLVLASGDPAAELSRIADEHGATKIFASRRLEPIARDQESRLRERLDSSATLVLSDDAYLRTPGSVTTQTGNAYKVFTPFYRAASALGEPARPTSAPDDIRWNDTDVDSVDLDDLALLPTEPDWAGGLRDFWTVGEDAAHARIAAMNEKIRDYAEGRDLPAEDHTSGLSPHLHFGEVSPRRVWHAITGNAREKGVEDAAEPFIRQLYWRDFSSYLLFHFDGLPDTPLRPEFHNFPWTEDNEALKAWQAGQTGYPIVDAGMRQLWETGWMHNRVRMIVASLLVKHLLIPWQHGADWFLDTLVDADLANNSASWQWVAGCGTDAAPYFRIFNPIAQGQKFDPDGEYVRRWVPELREMPTQFIHEPWTADDFTQQTSGVIIGKDYPAPIIEHKAGRERALEAYQAMRSATAA